MADLPTWLGGIGSVGTAIIAVWLWRKDRSNEKEQQIAEQKERLRRLVVGLKAEIAAAVEVAAMRRTSVDHTLSQLAEAKAQGASIAGGGTLPAGSMALTEAILYRSVAADLGRFPPEIIRRTVSFYTHAQEIERVTSLSNSAAQAFQTLQTMLPRFQMNGSVLIASLEKFERDNFDEKANVLFSREEMQALADRVGYPLAEVLKERGLS